MSVVVVAVAVAIDVAVAVAIVDIAAFGLVTQTCDIAIPYFGCSFQIVDGTEVVAAVQMFALARLLFQLYDSMHRYCIVVTKLYSISTY